MKIPFSVYDFFGYLACGFFFMCAFEYATGGAWLLNATDLTTAQGLFWASAIYVVGLIIANAASALFEELWLRKGLGPAEETLWGEHTSGFWSTLFPHYYSPYSSAFRQAVESKAASTAGFVITNRRELYKHCHAVVKKDKATQERLNIFLTRYSFARNVALSFFLSALLFTASWVFDWRPDDPSLLWWALLALFLALSLLRIYVKFYLLYTQEVFNAYQA